MNWYSDLPLDHCLKNIPHTFSDFQASEEMQVGGNDRFSRFLSDEEEKEYKQKQNRESMFDTYSYKNLLGMFAHLLFKCTWYNKPTRL